MILIVNCSQQAMNMKAAACCLAGISEDFASSATLAFSHLQATHGAFSGGEGVGLDSESLQHGNM